MRIALLSDTHTNRGDKGDQPLYRPRFKAVIQAVNAARPDLILHAGDVTEGGRTEEFDDFLAQSAALSAPVRHVPGNHDVGAKRHPKGDSKQAVTVERVRAYEKRLGPSWWAEERNGFRFVAVNAPLFGSGLAAEAEQWAFLEKQCAGPAPTAPLVLLSHYPLFLERPEEAGDPYWNVEPEPRARLLGLLARPGVGAVRAVLSGHLHRPLDRAWRGVRLYTTPPVSFGLPRGKQPQGWTLVTLSPPGDVTAEFNPIGE